MNNNGHQIESEIVDHINKNKYVSRMNSNIANFIISIFEFDINFTEIKAKKYYKNYKPDIVITANEISKYISIKHGECNSVHQEHLYSFCNFLQENGVENSIIEKLRLFHFNDSTCDGSGSERKSAKDFYIEYPIESVEINKQLNQEDLAIKLIDRLLFKGEYANIPLVDYIYHGDLNSGIWCSREKIINYLLNSQPTSLAIHISKLYYQSLQRNVNRYLKDEFRRYYVQFKWYSIKNDLINIITKKA